METPKTTRKTHPIPKLTNKMPKTTKSLANSSKIGIALLLFLSLLAAANAYTTNGTEKTFSFAVTSGANYYTEGGNFSTWTVVGDISSTTNSSNFRTELGFLRTTGYIIGESCDSDNDCAGNICCNNICQKTCPGPPAPPSPPTSIGGEARTVIPQPVPSGSYVRFFDLVKANQEVSLNIRSADLPLTGVKLTTNQDIESVTLSFLPVSSPKFTIDNSYSYFEITSDKLNSGKLLSFIIKFKVRIASGYIKEIVSLNVYSNDWVKLPTIFTGEDSEYYYYESNIRGFSLFAITGQKRLPVLEELKPEVQVPTEEKIEEAAKVIVKEEPKKPKPTTGFAIAISLISFVLLLALLAYSYPKLEYMRFKNLFNKFNNLLAQAKYYISMNMLAEAKKAYFKLVSYYKRLIKYPTSKNFKLDLYKSLRSIHDELVKMVDAGQKDDIKHEGFKEKIHGYIEENLDKGYSLDSIKESFIRHGYSQKLANKLLSGYRVKNFIMKGSSLFLVLILLYLMSVLFYKPDITTLAFITKEYNFTDNVGQTFNESSEYSWYLENNGVLKSVMLNGEVKDRGIVKIYLRHENQTYLAFSTEIAEKTGIEGIIGFVVKRGEIIIDVKDNLTDGEQAIINMLAEDINRTRNDVAIYIEVSDSVKKEISGSITSSQVSLVDELGNLLDSRIDSKKDMVKLKIESGFGKIGIPEDMYNLTPINETAINQSVNLSLQINETINITANLTNATIANETANVTAKNIEIVLEYKKGSLYDEDNNGVENINSIVDLTVENSKFSWDLNQDNLCTRWDVYPADSQQSTTVCYGSSKCCGFAELSPKRDSWSEPYYASYGKEGAAMHNTVSAQVLYIDYNLSPSEPFVDIHYSEWKNLTVEFYEGFTKFSSACAETCILPELNSTSYQLVIEISNSSLILSSIAYQILKPEIANSMPVLLKNFSDVLIYKRQSHAVNLSEYFYDGDNDTLIFSYYNNSGLDVSIVNATAILAAGNFIGTSYMFFTANDSIDTSLSNIFKIEVKERKEMPKILRSLRHIIGLE